MPTFTSEAALRAYIEARAKVGVAKTGEEINDVLEEKVGSFYGAYAPTSYIRTGTLRDSLKNKTAGLRVDVGFDEGSMWYAQGVMKLQHTGESDKYGWATWDGAKVLETAMHGSHGGWRRTTGIWEPALAQLGDIEELTADNMRAAGLPLT